MIQDPDNIALLLKELRQAQPGDRARRLGEPGPNRERSLQQLIDHASRMTASDARKAEDMTALVVSLADEAGSDLTRARARRARARALSYTGKLDEALNLCSEGVMLAEQAGNAIEAGRARLASMHALCELGRLDEAIKVGSDARQAFLDVNEPALAARADINMSIAHQRRDDPSTAMACLDRARPYFENDPLTLGHLENSRGEALIGLNDFEGAEEAFLAALRAFQSTNAHLTAAIAEGNLADLAARQGRLQRSMFHFERARRHLESNPSPGHLARLIAEQAEALGALGMPADALREFDSALPELDRLGLALEAARARSGMGLALLRLRRLAEAETALAAAAKAFDELGHSTARARIDLMRAEIAGENGRTAEARGMVMRALAQVHNCPIEAAAARQLLAQLAMDEGRYAEADGELALGLAIAQQLDLAPLLADLHHARGRLHRLQAQNTKAVEDYSAAVEQVERVRSTLRADRFRAAFLGSRSQLYESLLVSLLDSDHADRVRQAFGVAELARSRLLLDRLGGLLEAAEAHDPQAYDASNQPLLVEVERLRSTLNALYSRMDDERIAADAATTRRLTCEIRERERELDVVERRLATTSGLGDLYASPAGLETIQSGLTTDCGVVEYAMADGELLAFVITRKVTTVIRDMARAVELEPLVRRMQFQMDRALRPGALDGSRANRLTEDANRELAALHDQLIKPLESVVSDVDRLMIIPHGVLHLVPFHALWNGRQHLVERFGVRMAPSASVLAQVESRRRDRPSALTGVVVGVADEIAPQIESEAVAVGRLLRCAPSNVLIGAQATVSAVGALASQADILHLACHGRFTTNAPMGSGLKLADGWLTLRDIYRLKLRARLVSLSGCETGVNLVEAGDELLGLLHGFFAAGASSILASLWRVNDQTTLEYMSTLYELMPRIGARDGRIAAALRQTQLSMLERHRHPALWAAFFLAGGE